jgi:hypothetical protein
MNNQNKTTLTLVLVILISFIGIILFGLAGAIGGAITEGLAGFIIFFSDKKKVHKRDR